jgi:hypothetical protein
MFRKLTAACLIALGLAISASAGTAKADSAVQINANTTLVINHGNNPGDTCEMTLIVIAGNTVIKSVYDGFLVLVANANMMKLQCHTKLVFGPGVDKKTSFDFDNETQMFNPGNVANLDLRL